MNTRRESQCQQVWWSVILTIGAWMHGKCKQQKGQCGKKQTTDIWTPYLLGLNSTTSILSHKHNIHYVTLGSHSMGTDKVTCCTYKPLCLKITLHTRNQPNLLYSCFIHVNKEAANTPQSHKNIGTDTYSHLMTVKVSVPLCWPHMLTISANLSH